MILVMLEILLISYAIANNAVLPEIVEAILKSTVESTDSILTVDVDINIGYPRWNYRLHPSLARECVKIKPTYSIINIDDDIESPLRKMFTSCLLNPKGNFVLLAQKEQSLQSIFETLLQYFIDKVIVLVTIKKSCIIYAYKKVTNGFKYYRSGSYKDGELLLNKNIFKTSLKPGRFKSLKALSLYYPPYVTDEKTGIISEVMQLVGSRLNMAINMTLVAPEYFGTITNNNNFSGVYLDLANRKYECYAGLNSPPEKAPYYFDLTWPIVEDRFFSKMEEGDFGWVQALQLNLDMPISLKIKLSSTKFALMSHVITTLILNTIYRSRLYYLITDDQPMLKIETAEDIMDTTLKAGVYSNVLEQFNSSTEQSRFNQFIKENYIICDASDYCINRTAFQKDIFTATLCRKIDYLIPLSYLDENGKSLLHVIKDFDISFLQIPLVFLKGHPLFDRINRYLIIMKENGLVDLQYKKVQGNCKKAMSLALHSSNLKAYPLNLVHFEGVFIAYGIAVIINIIVFILEVLTMCR